MSMYGEVIVPLIERLALLNRKMKAIGMKTIGTNHSSFRPEPKPMGCFIPSFSNVKGFA